MALGGFFPPHRCGDSYLSSSWLFPLWRSTTSILRMLDCTSLYFSFVCGVPVERHCEPLSAQCLQSVAFLFGEVSAGLGRSINRPAFCCKRTIVITVLLSWCSSLGLLSARGPEPRMPFAPGILRSLSLCVPASEWRPSLILAATPFSKTFSGRAVARQRNGAEKLL